MENYLIARGEPPRSRRDITPATLLRYYHRTGVQIPGRLELRVAWRFNELKSRSYYCAGGDAFWESYFLKDITFKLLELLPCTHPFSRYEVQRIGRLPDGAVLITYDYESFTTRLAELKYFLWYLAQDLYDVEIQVLDVREGVRSISLGELLLQYNESINRNQEFYTNLLNFTSDTDFYQSSNGSLGSQGNIGLSMLNHGLSLSSFTNTPEEDLVVGDDALIQLQLNLMYCFMIICNKLGRINTDKFTLIPRPPIEKPEDQVKLQFKFLKRPISVDFDGRLFTGFLDDFPNLAQAFFGMTGDGLHTCHPPDDERKLIKSFATQWGRFLERYHRSAYALEQPETVEIILSIIGAVYDKFGLPTTGSLPFLLDGKGHLKHYMTTSQNERAPINFILPPCDSMDVFSTHFMDLLYDRYFGLTMQLAMTDPTASLPEDLVPGLDVQATGGRLLSLLVDLGYLRVEMMTEFVEVTESSITALKERMKKERQGQYVQTLLYNVTVLKPMPFWYSDLYYILYHSSNVPARHGDWETLTSFLGSDSDSEYE